MWINQNLINKAHSFLCLYFILAIIKILEWGWAAVGLRQASVQLGQSVHCWAEHPAVQARPRHGGSGATLQVACA